MAQKLVQILQERFGSSVIVDSHGEHGDDTVVVAPAHWRQVAEFLRDDVSCRMEMLVDLCGVDYPDRSPRFELVVHLHSVALGHRLRLKARLGDEAGQEAEIESLVSVWPSANWFERETWDMMGIRFLHHPDLRRILTYPEFEGHPLRKDYPATRTQPLVPYREGPDVLDKQAPFGPDEGMSFGRKSFELERKPLDFEKER